VVVPVRCRYPRHHYGVWHLLRRLRRRNRGADTTHMQTVVVRQSTRAAIGLFDWLAKHSLTLAPCAQEDFDGWLADDASHHRNTGHFLRWVHAQRLTSLDLPAVRWGGPSGVIDTEARWDQARWLLRDETINVEDRVAGLLVLLYAQTAAAISRLTLTRIDTSDDHVRLRLGGDPVVLPERSPDSSSTSSPTAEATTALGSQGTSTWLFPGGQPGRPISADRLAERLRQLDLPAGPTARARSSNSPPTSPPRSSPALLGIHISVAVQWQRAATGDWAAYAADMSRRPTKR